MRNVAIIAVALGAATAIWLRANRRVRGHKHRRVRAEDVLLLAEDRDPRQQGTGAFAAYGESQPIGRGRRFVAALPLRSGVTLRDLIEREWEGS